jgi:phosphate-selective porin
VEDSVAAFPSDTSSAPGAVGWASTDVFVTAPVVRQKYGSVTFGKTKETFVYEMVGDSANLPQMERLLTPFFTSRNVGIKYFNSIAHDRMSISGGWFNDWWSKGKPYDGSSNHFTARVTALPVMSEDKSSFLHLAFGVRHIGATNGTLQLTGKIESNVSSDYVDTGKFNALSSTNYSFEGLANSGPVSFLGEYVYSTNDAPAVGNPSFYGTYLTGSWVITGENRPYDPTVAYARRIIPRHSYGAWEIVGRIGRVDLTNKAIQGGAFNSYSANISWWPNRRYRIVAGYGRYDLNRNGIVGTTNQFHSRIQWIY